MPKKKKTTKSVKKKKSVNKKITSKNNYDNGDFLSDPIYSLSALFKDLFEDLDDGNFDDEGEELLDYIINAPSKDILNLLNSMGGNFSKPEVLAIKISQSYKIRSCLNQKAFP